MFRPGLIALLLVEVLYLTVRFDSQALDGASSPWLQAMAWSPQYLRLAITITVVTLLLEAWRHRSPLAGGAPTERFVSPVTLVTCLAVHFAALALFIRASSAIFERPAANVHAGFWVIAWLVFGSAALGAWTLAFSPRHLSLLSTRAGRALAGLGLALGAVAWVSGYATEALWRPLAHYTFSLTSAILGVVYPQVVSDPARLVLGTSGFKVAISPECSGYEGVGLLLAFLSIYLWLFRRELRFPDALLLLPLGAVTIWFVNVARIVVLIILGSSGWSEIALGGFHSQAGWIAFNAVGLAFVAVLNRGRFFMKQPGVEAAERSTAEDWTTPYLAPFLVVMVSAMLTGAFSAGIDWLYPVRVVAAVCVLWAFRRHYSNLGWTLSWRAVAIGCVTFAIWIALVPSEPGGAEGWPAALQSVPVHWAAAWLALRVVGYTIAVPLVEELAFRGYLIRRLMRADFQHLPLGLFTWSSFLLSSVLFGALHGAFWLAGTVAGMTFALALYQRRALGDAVLAHATTNALIAVYVFATGRWSIWS